MATVSTKLITTICERLVSNEAETNSEFLAGVQAMQQLMAMQKQIDMQRITLEAETDEKWLDWLTRPIVWCDPQSLSGASVLKFLQTLPGFAGYPIAYRWAEDIKTGDVYLGIVLGTDAESAQEELARLLTQLNLQLAAVERHRCKMSDIVQVLSVDQSGGRSPASGDAK